MATTTRAILRLPQQALDAEGQPVMLNDGGSDPVSVDVDRAVIAQLEAEDTTQPLYTAVRGLDDAGSSGPPRVTEGSVRLSPSETQSIVGQVRRALGRNTRTVLWADDPAGSTLVYEWLYPESRPLVAAVTGHHAEIKIPEVIVTSSHRRKALERVDTIFAIHSSKEASRETVARFNHPPITSAELWFAWVATLPTDSVSLHRQQAWRATLLPTINVVLDNLSSVNRTQAVSYQTGRMIDANNSRGGVTAHLVKALQDIYKSINRRATVNTV